MRLIDRIELAILRSMEAGVNSRATAKDILCAIRDPGPAAINHLSGFVREHDGSVYPAWRDMIDTALSKDGVV